MRVLFLEIDQQRDWAVASIGPACLAAYLRQHGHEVTMLRVHPDLSAGTLVEQVQALDPGLIGVSLTSRQWLRARTVVAQLRAELDIPVIAGGLHPTFAPEMVLAAAGFDYVCLGEGEAALLELVETLERRGVLPPEGIENIWAADHQRPRVRAPFEPVDALPFMARDMLDERHGVVHMSTQRGCPFPCTYCAARQLADLYDGAYASYGRRRSQANVLAELAQIREASALNYVIFLDDTFTIHHAWVAAFCRLYAERFAIGFSIHARVETVSRKMLDGLAAAGCRHVVFGVESGSERVRRDIMQRTVSNQRIEDAFAWARDAGILVTANYIIGTPGETRADIEQTLALHRRLAPDDFGCFVFYPYPGTALFHLCREKGYLPQDYNERPANHRETILTLPDLSAADIADYYQQFAELRIEAHLARLGPDQAGERESVIRDIERDAASG